MAVSIGSLWIPLAAEFTVAHVADSEVAPLLLTQLPAEVRSVLGAQHYTTPELRAECSCHNRELVATRRSARVSLEVSTTGAPATGLCCGSLTVPLTVA